MNAVPLTLEEANQFIANYHRHHTPVKRDKYRVGCEEEGKLAAGATMAEAKRWLKNAGVLWGELHE